MNIALIFKNFTNIILAAPLISWDAHPKSITSTFDIPLDQDQILSF